MITSMKLLLLFSSALIELGTSPLVEKGHVHDWVELPDQHEGEIGLHDRNWSRALQEDGKSIALALLRSGLEEQNSDIVFDLIVAADCREQRLGVLEAYLFKPEMKSGGQKVTFEEVDWDAAFDMNSPDEKAIFEAACSGTAAS